MAGVQTGVASDAHPNAEPGVWQIRRNLVNPDSRSGRRRTFSAQCSRVNVARSLALPPRSARALCDQRGLPEGFRVCVAPGDLAAQLMRFTLAPCTTSVPSNRSLRTMFDRRPRRNAGLKTYPRQGSAPADWLDAFESVRALPLRTQWLRNSNGSTCSGSA
jgi:hypothetical protein